jgi:glycosyltransferase involved in cell wall biosynthesis
MKILQLPNYYPPHNGGIENTCHDIVSITNMKYENFVLCFNDKRATVIENFNETIVMRIGIIVTILSQSIAPSYKKSLQNVINEYKPDYIHIHLPNPLAMIALLSCKYQKKIIVHWHSDIIKQKMLKYLFRAFEIKLCERADKIIATSPNYVEYSDLLKQYKGKVIVIPSIVSDKKMIISDNIRSYANQIKKEYSNKTICLTIGRHVSYKGFKYLIDSAKLLDKSKYIFVFIGKGPLTKSLKKRARDLQNVLFLGSISDDEMKMWQLACDIFCFSSITKNEAFGLSLAETMYFGKPAVTYTIKGSGVNYVSVDKITGLEAPNKNVKAYAGHIELLATDFLLREEYGKNAHERIINNFVKEQMLLNLKCIYPNL